MPIQKNTFIDVNNQCRFLFDTHGEYIIAGHFVVTAPLDFESMVSVVSEFVEEIKQTYLAANYIVNYPGTQNRLFAKAIIESVQRLGLSHKILYNGNLWNDTTFHFVDSVINCNNESHYGWTCKPDNDQFLECSICAAIRANCVDLVPWRYYIIDENNNLIIEQIEKPITGRFIHSARLRERFQQESLRFINGALN